MLNIDFIVVFLFVITVHEYAHALVADYLGDPTARLRGRMTLNPLAHIDPMGALVFVITALSGFAFGWAKPVPIDPYNLRDPRRDSAMIAAAGPISNFLLFLLSLILLKLVLLLNISWLITPPIINLFRSLMLLNLALGFFNLIPVYPLDGSKILLGLLPLHLAQEIGPMLTRYSYLWLILLIVTKLTQYLVYLPTMTVYRLALQLLGG